MRLQKGQQVPHFQVKDLQGNDYTPENQKGSWTLLSFYRYASCPFCNLRIYELHLKHEEFKKAGLKLAAIFQSPKEKIQNHAGNKKLGYPLIFDPEQKLYRLFQLETSWSGFLGGMLIKMPRMLSAMQKGYLPGSIEGKINQMPADFLIDPEGVIQIAYYGSDLADHLPLRQITEALEQKKS